MNRYIFTRISAVFMLRSVYSSRSHGAASLYVLILFVCFPVPLILKLSNAIWKVSHSYTVWAWAGNMINKLLSATSAEYVLQVVHLGSKTKRVESLCKYKIISALLD